MASEKDMEYIIAANPEKYIEPDLKLISRQYTIGSYRFDLLFQDRHGAKLIVELQKGTLDRNHTYKILDYFDEFKERKPHNFVDVMIIANKIPRERQRRLKSYGISFKEIDETEFSQIDLLRAHWEQFFDKHQVNFKRHYSKSSCLDYSPSFYLPKLDCWIEIKYEKPTDQDILSAIKFCLNSHKEVHIFVGEPENEHSYRSFMFCEHYLPPERICEMMEDPKEYAVDTFSEEGFVQNSQISISQLKMDGA